MPIMPVVKKLLFEFPDPHTTKVFIEVEFADSNHTKQTFEKSFPTQHTAEDILEMVGITLPGHADRKQRRLHA